MIMRNNFYTCIIIVAITKSNIYDTIFSYRISHKLG